MCVLSVSRERKSGSTVAQTVSWTFCPPGAMNVGPHGSPIFWEADRPLWFLPAKARRRTQWNMLMLPWSVALQGLASEAGVTQALVPSVLCPVRCFLLMPNSMTWLSFCHTFKVRLMAVKQRFVSKTFLLLFWDILVKSLVVLSYSFVWKLNLHTKTYWPIHGAPPQWPLKP